MLIEARRDVIDVRVGSSFGAPEVARINEAVTSLGPWTRLTIDFGAARDCDDAALVLLATLLRHATGQIALRGLTHHQWRLLTYVGLEPDGRAPAGA